MSVDRYKNISHTRFFSKLKVPIINQSDMMIFLTSQIHLSFVISDDNVASIISCTDLTSQKLDAIFLLIMSVKKFQNEITTIFQEVLLSTLPESNTDFIKTFINCFIKILIGCLEANGSEDNTLIICDHAMNNCIDIFTLNDNLGKDMEEDIENYLKNNMEKIIEAFHKIHQKWEFALPTFLKSTVGILEEIMQTTSESDNLQSYIDSNISLISDLDNDPDIQIYYEYGNPEICNFDKSHREYFTSTQNQCENDEIILNIANVNLNEIGMEIVPEYNIMHISIVECILSLHLDDSIQNITDKIIFALETERDTPGYINKYDHDTLYNYYIIVSIANNISINYDKMITILKENGMIPTFPQSILLPLLSRIYNVTISLYDHTFNVLHFDNVIRFDAYPIDLSIYQNRQGCYFIIRNICKNIDQSYSSGDIIDV